MYRQRISPRSNRPTGRSRGFRFILALIMAAISLYSYLGSKEVNTITGEEQYISITKEQEIAIGLQAVPRMAQQYGGLYPDQELQDYVDDVGFYLVDNSFAYQGDYPFEFNLLSDTNTVNAFALPGGQIFMTAALYDLVQTEDQVAAVLSHEIVHVLARHSAQQMAKQELTNGLSGAIVLASYDPDNPSSQSTAQITALIGNLINMKYGREDELESDYLGVCILSQAGYDPNAMLEVMHFLDSATAGGRPPEFFSSHPSPENRIQYIQQAINNLDTCP